jgi:uncharacterized membrane protein
MTPSEITHKSVRFNQKKVWVLLPTLLGVFALISFMTINDWLSTALIFLGVVFVGLGLGYFLAGHPIQN